MALSDCPKCWDTPCRCGHGYQHWSNEELEKQISLLQNVLASRGREMNIESHRDDQVSQLNREKLSVPQELFPIIREFPLGSLVLINAPGAFRSPETFERYIDDIKSAFPGSPVAEICHPSIVNAETLLNQRHWVREQRLRAVDVKCVSFLIQQGRYQDVLDQEADFSFYIHEGQQDTLLIELGKCRVAHPVLRTVATIYTKGKLPTPTPSRLINQEEHSS